MNLSSLTDVDEVLRLSDQFNIYHTATSRLSEDNQANEDNDIQAF